MKILLALFAMAAAFTASAVTNNLSEIYAGSGRLILTNLDSAPFPHPRRAEGHKSKEKIYSAANNYSDNTVAIFIPKGFRKARQFDVIVHFHGWNNNVAGVFPRYKLIEQLIESGKNTILIVPQGPMNAPDSFGGKLEDQDGFKRFMADIQKILGPMVSPVGGDLDIGRIILSGHSGGYQVISSILDRGGLSEKVSEVWLFDALYAQADKFLSWQTNHHGRLLNIYTEHGGTKSETEKMIQTLKDHKVAFKSANEEALKDEDLAFKGPVFVFTQMEHNDVLDKPKTFLQFLRTSGLQPVTSGSQN